MGTKIAGLLRDWKTWTCAEVIQSLAAVLGVILMTLIGDNPVFLFATTTILFIIALFITAKHGAIR